jgi:hypothetical protein
MAGLDGTAGLPDLTPVAAEAGAVEGDPRPVYTWAGPPGGWASMAHAYTPSDGGLAPRLVAGSGAAHPLGVWDTGTDTLLRALQAPESDFRFMCVVTYRRSSDGRPRIAA